MIRAAALTAKSTRRRHSQTTAAASIKVTADCTAYASATGPPHIRTHAKTLWISSQPVSPASSTTVRVKWAEARNASHTGTPKASVVTSTSAATVAAAATK